MSTFVPRVHAKRKFEIERESHAFLQKHFPGSLESPERLDVLELWELLDDEYDLRPGVADLSDGVEGMTWPDGRVFVSEETYLGAARGQGRQRFTMCHEAYHALFHRPQISKVLVDTGELALYRRAELNYSVDPEWQANAFASSILMPARMVQRVVRESHGKTIEDMMWRFGVSKTAATIRIAQVRREGLV